MLRTHEIQNKFVNVFAEIWEHDVDEWIHETLWRPSDGGDDSLANCETVSGRLSLIKGFNNGKSLTLSGLHSLRVADVIGDPQIGIRSYGGDMWTDQ